MSGKSSEHLQEIGEAIRTELMIRMKHCNMTQEDVSRVAGLNKNTVSRILGSDRVLVDVKLSTLVAIAEAVSLRTAISFHGIHSAPSEGKGARRKKETGK